MNLEVQDPVDKIRDTAIHFIARDMKQEARNMTQSPIEEMMYWALHSHLSPNYHGQPLVIICQGKVENYRVDFLIEIVNKIRIVVERDGHEFHERTKEQAQRDRARDRSIQRKGYFIFRFTGSEIFRSPMACAREVEEHIYKTIKKQIPFNPNERRQ